MRNVLINIVLPIAILLFLSDESRLGAVPALLLSVAIPAGYGVYDLWRSRKLNISSLTGIVSVVLTGVFGLLKLDAQTFALKEAAVPVFFAALIVLSDRTRYPIARLLADQVLVRDRINAALDANGTTSRYRMLLTRTGWIWAGTMVVSGISKFILTSMIVTSDAGTAEFNRQLAHLSAIRIPTTTALTMVMMIGLLVYLVRGAAAVTGLPPADTYRGGHRLAAIYGRFSRVGRTSRAS